MSDGEVAIRDAIELLKGKQAGCSNAFVQSAGGLNGSITNASLRLLRETGVAS